MTRIISKTLLGDLRQLIAEARQDVARQVNSALGSQLTVEFGRGFGPRNLFRMIRFAEVFPNIESVSALRTQLGWTHFRQIIYLDDPLKRDFYAEMCHIERRSSRRISRNRHF